MRLPRAKFAAFAFLILLCAVCLAQVSQQAANIAEIQSLIRSRQYDRALELTRAALEKVPADYRVWTIQGIALSLKGDTTAALSSFDNALRFSPTYAPALKAEVEILFRSNDKRAIPLLERLLKADPGDVTAHEMLATLEKRNGNCPSANDHFRLAGDAINTHPES